MNPDDQTQDRLRFIDFRKHNRSSENLAVTDFGKGQTEKGQGEKQEE